MSQFECDNKNNLNAVFSRFASMKTKAILGISFAAAFAVTMIFAQYANAGSDGHLNIEESSVTVSGDGANLEARITVEGPISINGNDGAFGYGLLNDGTNNVLALTTHLCASDSTEQGAAKKCDATIGLDAVISSADREDHNDAAFHAHVLDLKGVVNTSSCSTVDGSTTEVDIASSGASNNVSPDWPVHVSGKHITVENVDTSELGDNGVEVVVSFGITPIWDNNGSITNLCLT
jgi:hypothetical protein